MTANHIKFFSTAAHPCSYLADQRAVTLFVDPKGSMDGDTYSQLSQKGFRRSGDFVYRPHCGSCNACVSVRVDAKNFQPSRQQKRVWKNNSDIIVTRRPAEFCEEHYQLYEQYITARHHDGDMYPPSEDQYQSFLIAHWLNVNFYEFRANGKLLAIAVTDVMENSLSAVYTFFDANEEKRSLGTYAILWQIEECKRLGLSYLYLGYWIRNFSKMSYKVKFRPIELLINGEWLKAR